MFSFVPLAQAPHTLSLKTPSSSYPSEDFSLRHPRHTRARHTQHILPFVDDVSSSPSELYASRQRYYEALAEARAAEAEYLQAQARARAEEARIERQRALQAAARQRAYEEEVARQARVREIEEIHKMVKSLKEERERKEKIELLKRRMFGMPQSEVDASRLAPPGHQPQTPDRREEQEALRAFFDCFYGATPVCKPAPTQTECVSIPPTTLSLSSASPASASDVPLKSRSAVPNSSPQPDEDAYAKFISHFFGVPLDHAKKSSPVKSTTPTAHATVPVPTPTPTETKPPTTPKIREDKSAEVAAFKIFAEMFGLGPALAAPNHTEKKTASPSTPGAFTSGNSTQAVKVDDVTSHQSSSSPAPAPSSTPAPVSAPPTDRPSSPSKLATHFQEELSSGKLDSEMVEVVANLLKSLAGSAQQQKPEARSESNLPGVSESAVKTSSSPTRPAISISIPAMNTNAPATSTPSLPEPPSPAESTHSTLSNHSTMSILSIDKIESSFHELRDSFTFPSSLDFVATATQPDGEDGLELAFTPTNAPLRAYEHSLNGLLEQLDKVESEGDESVRGRRREAVREVEMELERIERRVGEMRRAEKERRDNVEVKAEVEGAEEAEKEVEEVKEAKEAEEEAEVGSAAVDVTPEARTSSTILDDLKKSEAESLPASASAGEPQSAATTFSLVDPSDAATPDDGMSGSTSSGIDSIRDVEDRGLQISSAQDVDVSDSVNEIRSDFEPSTKPAESDTTSPSTSLTSTPSSPHIASDSDASSSAAPVDVKPSPSPAESDPAALVPLSISPSDRQSSEKADGDDDAVLVYGQTKDSDPEGPPESRSSVDEDEWTKVDA